MNVEEGLSSNWKDGGPASRVQGAISPRKALQLAAVQHKQDKSSLKE